MSVVFIPQETRRRNPMTGAFEPVHDLSPALAYGDLVLLHSPAAGGIDPKPMLEAMRRKLAAFSDDDYILATGNPAAIAAAVMIASALNRGRIKLLSWDRRTKQYLALQLDAR